MSKKEDQNVQGVNKPLMFRIITLGNSGVGKTSIINRYTKNVFNDNNSSTIGINFFIKELYINKKKVEIKLIDTCGQEKYQALSKAYLKNTDACFFVFALNDKDSFDDIKKWMALFNQNQNINDIPHILLGNKSDLKPEVEESIIDEFVNKEKIRYIKTSAKKNENINEAMEELCKLIFQKKNFSNTQSINNIIISDKKTKKKKKKCLSWFSEIP